MKTDIPLVFENTAISALRELANNSAIREIQRIQSPSRQLLAQLEANMRPFLEIQARVEATLRPYREMQARVEATLRPYREMQARVEATLRPYREMQDRVEATLRPYREMQARVEATMRPFRELQTQMEATMWPFEGLRTIGEQAAFALRQLKALEQYNDFNGHGLRSFEKFDALQAVITDFEESHDQLDEAQYEQIVDAVLEYVHRICSAFQSLSNRNDAAFVLAIIALLFAVYSHISGNEANDRIEKKLDDLSTLYFNLNEKVSEAEFYTIKRPTPLNVERRYHGAMFFWLTPGEEVELLKRSGKWIKVVAYDRRAKTYQEGWVLKKYMRRID